MTADSLDTKALQNLVAPPNGEKWGSLNSLEKVLATRVSASDAHIMMTPLFGTYELRLADAHLPSGEVDIALGNLGIDPSKSAIEQGVQLIDRCAYALEMIRSAFESPEKTGPSESTR